MYSHKFVSKLSKPTKLTQLVRIHSIETSQQLLINYSQYTPHNSIHPYDHSIHPPPPPQVVENFKSYAGVREIGPFHKCFTSIVGPNGSGKSNNIDAMLFVFGKKAKKLRLNKVRITMGGTKEEQARDKQGTLQGTSKDTNKRGTSKGENDTTHKYTSNRGGEEEVGKRDYTHTHTTKPNRAFN